MIVNRTLLKASTRNLLKALVLVLVLAGLEAAPAFAQDDQEYKREFNAGLEAYKAKNAAQAYDHWGKAADLSKKAGDTEIAEKAMTYVTQLDYANGLDAFKKDQAEEAIKHFDKGIQHYPNFAKNYYGKGLALKNLDRFDEAIASYKKAMEVAEKASDRKTKDAAEQAIRDLFVYRASRALASGGENVSRAAATEALGYLNQMKEHVSLDPDAYYYMAEAHKALGEYEQAVAAADQGLALHKGSKTDKAKFYFVKGEALMLNGDNALAKAAFEEARYGSFKAPAEHYITTL